MPAYSLKRLFMLLVSLCTCLLIFSRREIFVLSFSRILSLYLPPPISPQQFLPFISSHSRLPSIGFSPFRLLLIAVGSTPLTSVSGRTISSSTSSHTTAATLFAIFFTAERIFAIRKSGFLSDSHFAFHSPCIKVSSRSSVSSIMMSHLIFARISLPRSLFLLYLTTVVFLLTSSYDVNLQIIYFYIIFV